MTTLPPTPFPTPAPEIGSSADFTGPGRLPSLPPPPPILPPKPTPPLPVVTPTAPVSQKALPVRFLPYLLVLGITLCLVIGSLFLYPYFKALPFAQLPPYTLPLILLVLGLVLVISGWLLGRDRR